MEMEKRIHLAADYIRERLSIKPSVAIILGSGLGICQS